MLGEEDIDDEHDAIVPGGRDDEDDEEGFENPLGSELRVKKLVEECVRDHDLRFDQEVRAGAERNEHYILGEHFERRGGRRDANTLVPFRWKQGIPKIPRNYLRKLALTYAARIEEEQGTAKAWPNDLADIGKARVANAVIKHLHQQHDTPSVMFALALEAQAHSYVGMKTTWDTTAGPISPWTGQPMGSAVWDPLDCFQFGTSKDQRVENARWCFFRQPADYYEARHMLEEAGIHKAPRRLPAENIGETSREVEVIEFWHRAGARIPRGLYAVMVGGWVTEARPFPYDHGELPLSVWKINERRDSPFGATHVDDAIHAQAYINQLVSTIAKLTWDAGDTRLLALKSIIARMRGGNHMVPVDDVEAVSRGAKWLDMPDPPALLFAQLEETIKALHDLFGLNEALLGRAAADSSGKAIAYLNRLDGMALKGAVLNRNKFVLRYVKQAVALFQQYATEERVIVVAGQENALEAEAFTGADLAGLDIHFEGAPGSEHSSSVQAEEQDQLGMAGAIAPDVWAETRQTGLDETAFAGVQRKIVQAQVSATMHGIPQQADGTVDPAIAMQEIARAAAREVSAGRGQHDPMLQALYALAAQYRQLGMQVQQPMAQAQGAPPAPQEDPLAAVGGTEMIV